MHFKNIFIFNILNLVVADLNSTLRAGRIYNPIVQLVNFPNDPCTGASTSLTGICYSPEDCAGVSGGYADGKCAQGFGVCCVIRCQYTDSSNLLYSPRRDFPFSVQFHYMIQSNQTQRVTGVFLPRLIGIWPCSLSILLIANRL